MTDRDKLLEALTDSLLREPWDWMGYSHEIVEVNPPTVICLRHSDPLPDGTVLSPVTVHLPIVSVISIREYKDAQV